jgi:hypothetical protein
MAQMYLIASIALLEWFLNAALANPIIACDAPILVRTGQYYHM